MIDAVGRVTLSNPSTHSRKPFPMVVYDVNSVIGNIRLGKMRFNYAESYKPGPHYVRMTFVPDNKMLIYPDNAKSVQILEDALVLGILLGSMDTISTFGKGGLIPYNIVRDYGNHINQTINAKALEILKKYGFVQDSYQNDIYIYDSSIGATKILEYKERREKEMATELKIDADHILQQI